MIRHILTKCEVKSGAMRRVDVARCHIVPLSWPVDAGIWSSVELFSQLSNDLRLRGLHSPGIAVAHWQVDL